MGFYNLKKKETVLQLQHIVKMMKRRVLIPYVFFVGIPVLTSRYIGVHGETLKSNLQILFIFISCIFRSCKHTYFLSQLTKNIYNSLTNNVMQGNLRTY